MSHGSSFTLSINLSKGTSKTSEKEDDSESKTHTESKKLSGISQVKIESDFGSKNEYESSDLQNHINRGVGNEEDFPSKIDNETHANVDLINFNIPTGKNSRKRKHIIRTDFDNPTLLNQVALEAQQKEKERLQRLKAKETENDHIDQIAALQSNNYGQLPILDVDDIAEITGFSDDCVTIMDGGPSTSKAPPEVIDLSSDDDDIQEVGYVKRIVEPKLPIVKRQRWFVSDKERANRESMDHQHRVEQERLRRRQNAGDIEQVDLSSGMLIVNRGHPSEDPDIAVAPHLTYVLQPHQLGGIRFMYDNVVESLNEYSSTPGFGCILAHSMGLGKTLQVITFSEVFFRATKSHKVLIIVPVNTIQNWANEYEKWLPRYDTTGNCIRTFEVFLLGDLVKTFDQRVNMLEQWHQKGGVLLIGYDMFRLLIRATQPKKAPRMKLNFLNGQKVVRDEPADDFNKGYTSDGRIRFEANQIVRAALLDPGPDLVVCDEGHKIKNLNTDISSALSSIRTTRRIVLTGYPLQNNLMEYYCMVDFVRPKYLGEKKSFSIMFEKPIKNGQCMDSTPGDVKLALQRTHVLVEMLKGFVQRRTHHLLKTILPQSREYVILLRKSPLQHALYRNFLLYANTEIQKGGATFNPLKAFAACSKIWNHPDVLAQTLFRRTSDRQKEAKKQQATMNLKQKTLADALTTIENVPTTHTGLWDGVFEPYSNDLDIADVDEDTNEKPKRRGKKNLVSALMDALDIEDQGLKYDWAEMLMQHHTLGNIEHGFKMKIALDLIDGTTRIGEKILLFSQNLTALDLIESYLSKRMVVRNRLNSDEMWAKNKNYFRLDGSTNGSERERLVNKFNSDSSIHLFLISTRAGSLGINLVSANRCIILDACWNPCHDAQAVCRVYRYGQQRSTYIYRLIMDNSMEKAIFNRQVSKHGLQQRVVDDAKVDANVTQRELETLLMYDEVQDVVHTEWNVSEWNIEDPLLDEVVRNNSHMLAQKPFLHESLILEREDGLSEQEKREAQLLYERERAAENVVSYDVGDRIVGQPGPRMGRNEGNPIAPLGYGDFINPLRSTPFPQEIQAVDFRQSYPSQSLAGGVTMASAINGMSDNNRPFIRNPVYQQYSMNQNQYTPMPPNNFNNGILPEANKWIHGFSFPGALHAATPVSSHAGTMQRIILDRDFNLPLVQDSTQLRYITRGTEVMLVKAGQGGMYVKAPNGEILSAAGTILALGNQNIPSQFVNQNNLRLPPPLKKNTPEVIDLE